MPIVFKFIFGLLALVLSVSYAQADLNTLADRENLTLGLSEPYPSCTLIPDSCQDTFGGGHECVYFCFEGIYQIEGKYVIDMQLCVVQYNDQNQAYNANCQNES